MANAQNSEVGVTVATFNLGSNSNFINHDLYFITFNFLPSVITIWRMREIVSWERQQQDLMNGLTMRHNNINSLNTQLPVKQLSLL